MLRFYYIGPKPLAFPKRVCYYANRGNQRLLSSPLQDTRDAAEAAVLYRGREKVLVLHKELLTCQSPSPTREKDKPQSGRLTQGPRNGRDGRRQI